MSFSHVALAGIVSSLTVLAGCRPYPDEPQVVGGYVTLKTYGDLATAQTRARLACGDRRRVPAVMTVQGEGGDQTATFNCM
jgi:hypothetical protein